jgi:hypothetical protein
MFTSDRIAKGFAAALMLTLIGSAPVLARPMWSSAAPIEYLQYDPTPYFNLVMGSSPAYQYWRPNLAVESPTSACSTMRQVRSCTRHRWLRLLPHRTLSMYRILGMI